MPMETSDPLASLAPHLAAPETQTISARGRTAEVRRARGTETVSLGTEAVLRDLVQRILGPGRSAGPVAFAGFVGVASLPPSSSEPVLLLRRPSPLRVDPGAAYSSGILDPAVAQAAARLLAAGAGVACAGPSRQGVGGAVSALLALLPRAWRLVIVEDEPRIAPAREALRLRDPSPDTLAAADPQLVVLAGSCAPPVWAVPRPALVLVRARSPQAAASRLLAGSAQHPAPLLPHVAARITSDAVPLLLWIDASPRLEAAYEILPTVGASGEPCPLQMLAALDPASGRLLPTGAAPRDPDLAAAWDRKGGAAP
jgi:hypothetical protein